MKVLQCIKRTPKKYLKWSFLSLQTCIKRTIVSITQHARHRKCERLPPTIFSIFTLKNVTWRTLFDYFHSTVLVSISFRLYRACFTQITWFLQIWVAIHVYGTMINWSTLIKKLMQTYIIIVSGSILNVSTVNLNSIWDLISIDLACVASVSNRVIARKLEGKQKKKRFQSSYCA